MEKDIKTYIYIYSISYQNSNDIFYIGQTCEPMERFRVHIRTYGDKIKLEIIDKIINIEHEYIKQYLNKGYKLLNKEKLRSSSHNVGEILLPNTKITSKKLIDKNTGRIYKNINQYSTLNNISHYLILNHLKGNKTKISKQLNIEYYEE